MLENINSLEKFYEYIDNVDYENNDFHIDGDLIKIRKNFEELGLTDCIQKVQWELNFFEIMVRGTKLKHYAIYPDKEGNQIKRPDYENFSEDIFDYLRERLINCNNPLFKAKYGLILWNLKKDFEAVKICIDNYLELTDYFLKLESSDENEQYGLNIADNLLIAFYLSLETAKTAYRQEDIMTKIKYVLNEFVPKPESIFILKIKLIETMVEKNKIFQKEDFEPLLKYCWDLAGKYKSQTFTFAFLDSGKKIDEKLGTKTYEWIRKKAEYFEKLMSENNLWAPNYCLQALELYKQIKDTNKITELENLYPQLSNNIELQEFSAEIPREHIEKCIGEQKELINKIQNPETFIKYLIFSNNLFPKIKEMKDVNLEDNVFFMLASVQELDTKGHIKKQLNADEEKELFLMWQKYDIYMQIQSLCLQSFIQDAIIQDKFNIDSLIKYLSDKTWIGKVLNDTLPNNQTFKYCWLNQISSILDSFFSEFYYYLRDPQNNKPDFFIFIDLICIKIEGLLRDLFKLNGINTYRIKLNQTTEENNINQFLRDDDIFKFLSEDEVWFMKWLLIEKANLRNKVAHCLMFPQEYNFSNACFLMVAFLRLCKFDLNIKTCLALSPSTQAQH